MHQLRLRGAEEEVHPADRGGRQPGLLLPSEADAGSDVASMTTRAVRDGEDYVLTGKKCGSPTPASPTSTSCSPRPIRRAAHPGISAFIVEKDWGVQVTKLEHKLGLRGSPTGQLAFDECAGAGRQPRRRGGPGLLHRHAHPGPLAAHDRGAGRRHRTGRHRLRRRIHEGAQDVRQPIAELQGLQFMMADMDMKIEAARGLVYRACAIVDEGDPVASCRRSAPWRSASPPMSPCR